MAKSLETQLILFVLTITDAIILNLNNSVKHG